MSWPTTILILGLTGLAILLLLAGLASWHEFRKTRLTADQENDLRQLIHRYEQLAENTMDAQQRIAADVAELRSRTSGIEQVLRTVE